MNAGPSLGTYGLGLASRRARLLAAAVLLGSIWGASYLFIKVAVEDIPPAAMTELVTYLMPVFALFYGSTILDEPLTAAALGGLVLILLGVALASGERILGARVQEKAA